MSACTQAEAVLDRHFLGMRSRLLDLAAAFDRIERARGAKRIAQDERFRQLTEAVRALADNEPDRTARIQMVFSDPYEADWHRPRANA